MLADRKETNGIAQGASLSASDDLIVMTPERAQEI